MDFNRALKGVNRVLIGCDRMFVPLRSASKMELRLVAPGAGHVGGPTLEAYHRGAALTLIAIPWHLTTGAKFEHASQLAIA